jgi:hypothetical protein
MVKYKAFSRIFGGNAIQNRASARKSGLGTAFVPVKKAEAGFPRLGLIVLTHTIFLKQALFRPIP